MYDTVVFLTYTHYSVATKKRSPNYHKATTHILSATTPHNSTKNFYFTTSEYIIFTNYYIVVFYAYVHNRILHTYTNERKKSRKFIAYLLKY